MLTVKASMPSWTVTGRANYNFSKAEKNNNRYNNLQNNKNKKYKEFDDNAIIF